MLNNKMKYYILWYRFNYQNHYTIWCSDYDGKNFLLSKNEVIPYFSSKRELQYYAKTNKINLEYEEPILHNLDQVKVWIHNTTSKISCSEFIAAWNLFEDITSSVIVSGKTQKLINNSYHDIYTKLYSGSNIVASRKSNRKYYPEWNLNEKLIIKKIMLGGFKLVKEKFRKHA